MKVVILLRKTFPKNHSKARKETNFREKLLRGIGCPDCSKERGITCYYCSRDMKEKIHTCRENYEYWKKKIDRLKAEGGVLSVRQWSGKPFRSPQEIIVDIPAENVGVQKLDWCTEETASIQPSAYEGYPLGMPVNISELSENDSLSLDDFRAWLKGYDLSKPMAIIHFTKFRY
jgi:hypothetical protein